MAQVRGVMVMNAVHYVKETYGPDAQERVVRAMDPRHRATFLAPIREASFKPVEDFVAYLEAAQRTLAPNDPAFFRRLGHAAGRREREVQGFKVMVADPASTMRMGPTVWRAFYDTGRLEVAAKGPREAVVTVHDFPPARCLCERTSGAWEGLLSSEVLHARVEEVRCTANGAPHCEFHLTWTEAGP